MNRTRTFLMAICCLISSISFAQAPSFSKILKYPSAGNHFEDNRIALGTIGTNAFYYNKSDNSIYRVEGETMAVASQKLDKKFWFDNVTVFNNSICFFKGEMDSKTKKTYLYMQKMNPATLLLEGTYETIYEMDYVGKKSRLCYINCIFSPDRNKMLVTCELMDKAPVIYSWGGLRSVRDSKLLNLSYAIFDENGTLFSKNTHVTTGLNYPLSIADYAVDNNGTAFMAGITNMEAKNSERAARKVFVIQYSEEGEPTPAEITLPQSKYPERAFIIANNQAQLFVTGYYTANKMNNMLGLFSATIDIKEFTEKEAFVSEFSEEFLIKDLPTKEINDFKKDMKAGSDFEKSGYIFAPLQLLSDGTPVMTIMKKYVVTVSSQNGTTYFNYYGDIICANFQVDGEAKWINKLTRNIILNNGGPYGTVGVAIDADNQVNIYYTLMESMAFPITVTKTSDAKLLKYSISADGQESNVEIYNSKSSKMAAKPGEMIVVPELSKIIMTGNKGDLPLNWFFMSIPME